MTRKRLIVGNWKMNKTGREAAAFVAEFAPRVADVGTRVGLAVPFTAIEAAFKAAAGTSILIGAQNMHDHAEGAYTGEVSAAMLKAAGAHFVILGHSERRDLFGETDAFVNRKVKRALSEGLVPLVCVGESQVQRAEGHTEDVISTQVCNSLVGVTKQQLTTLIVAYEPLWAIGTGRNATPDIAQGTHELIRQILAKHWGAEVAAQVTLLYGGSVKPSNASALMAEPDIDGLLVGGASLDVDSFSQIVHYHSLVSGS